MLPTAPSHQPLARGVRGHGPEPPFLLQSCSMVAHCSDFFQVWASSSFLVLTASSNKLMLSWKPQTNKKGKNQHRALLLPSSTTHTTPELQPLCSPRRADPPQHPNPSPPCAVRLRLSPIPSRAQTFPNQAPQRAPCPAPSPISSRPGSAQLPRTCSVPGAHEASGTHTGLVSLARRSARQGPGVQM